MALRLTTTSLSSDEFALAPDSLGAGEDAAAMLAASARQALARRDCDAFRKLFTNAIAIGHEVPRYRASKELTEMALGACSHLDARSAAKLLLATADGLLAALAKDPAQPLLLNYAGVALYELWALDAAAALFKAAGRLDPELPNVERNLEQVAERKRTRKRAGAKPHALVLALAQTATKIAAEARPATGRRISLCMIVRDEQEMLPRTLAAVAPAVDEIIIVDTGSQDRTIEIAKSFGATVIEREWTGDFSAARNASFDAATGDWILYLDADEVLDDGEASALRALAGQTWRDAIFVEELNYTGSEELGAAVLFSALRLFRNRPEYRFHGRLHEQIAGTLPKDLPERIGRSSVQITHYGYLTDVRDAKDKSRRNLELLERQRADGDDSPFIHFNLGAEYFALSEFENAANEFATAWQQALDNDIRRYEFIPSLATKRTDALRSMGRFEDSLAFADEALTYFPDFTDLIFEQGLCLLRLERNEEALAKLDQAIAMGDAPSRYTALRGAGTFLPRMILATYHQQQGEIDRSLELLHWCVGHYPERYGLVNRYATVLGQAGRDADQIVAEIEGLVPEMTARLRFNLALALVEQGATHAAEQQFWEVLKIQPHSGPARAALVETLIFQHQYERAADIASGLDENDRLALSVLHSEVLARVLAHDSDGARRSLDRAREAGLDSAEVQMFEVWLTLLAGEGPDAPVPVAAMAVLESAMTTLLRSHDFDNFELTRRLYDKLVIPLRERRERMAMLYMRTGFVRSAAREWLAVCELAPDARALIGLTQVSLANAQPQAALAFAQQATALEPHNHAASSALKAAEAAMAAEQAQAAEAGSTITGSTPVPVTAPAGAVTA